MDSSDQTILIIEDESAIAEMLAMVLEDEGYRIVLAGNGQEGLSCLETEPFDLVLCDVMMPVLDGWEVFQIMQDTPAYHNIPVVLMSAARDVFSEKDSHYVFLSKPFEIDRLLETITRLLEME